MRSSNPRQRFRLARAQHLRSRLFQPGLLQHPNWGGAAETLKRDLQRADAASRYLGDLRDGQRRFGIGAHEGFGPSHIAGSGGCFLPPYTVAVIMRQTEQHTESKVLLEAADRDLVCQQRIRMFQLGEQEVYHATDCGAGTMRLIEGRLECDGFDLLSVQQSLKFAAK